MYFIYPDRTINNQIIESRIETKRILFVIKLKLNARWVYGQRYRLRNRGNRINAADERPGSAIVCFKNFKTVGLYVPFPFR